MNAEPDLYNDFIELVSDYESILLDKGTHKLLVELCERIVIQKETGGTIFLAGNGASMSISSHAATDLVQHAGVRSIALSDHNLITAFGNDYGYEYWLSRALELLSCKDDLTILVSASGTSRNIVNSVRWLKENNRSLIGLSGFNEANYLNATSDISLWVNSCHYNIVENVHLFWLLSIIRALESKQIKDSLFREHSEELLTSLRSENVVIAINLLIDGIVEATRRGGKVIFLGNGGAASISSHVATDLTKAGRKRAVSFNDHNLLTCFANDFGNSRWMARALEFYSDPMDFIVLLSSTGESENLIEALSWAKSNSRSVFALTGGSKQNRLNRLSENFLTVDSGRVNICQTAHACILLFIVDYFADKVTAS